jgi:hypothetical protein
MPEDCPMDPDKMPEDYAVYPEIEAALAKITPFHCSPKAEIWYRLLRKHAFPRWGSLKGVAILLAQWREIGPKKPDEIFPIREKIADAYLRRDKGFIRKLGRAEKLKFPFEQFAAHSALLAYRELWLELGRCPTIQETRDRADALRKQSGLPKVADWWHTFDELKRLF